MRVLVDTNVISYVLKEREPFFSKFTEALETDNVFVSSDVVDYEIRRYLVLNDAKRQLARRLRYADEKRHRVVVFGLLRANAKGRLVLVRSRVLLPKCCCNGSRCV